MLLVAIAYLSYQLWNERAGFPVHLVNCSKIDGSCFTVGKFTNMPSCQFDAEMGSMGCDKDPASDVQTCKPNSNVIAEEHCETGR